MKSIEDHEEESNLFAIFDLFVNFVVRN